MINFFHVPSIAINDSLTKKQIFIENSDPGILIKQFLKKLTRRQETISKEVWEMYQVVDRESSLSQVRERWIDWVNQVPIFGFNSEKYDLNLVKEHFIRTLSNMNDVNVMKKDNSYIFLMTPSFKLDIKNYLTLGLNYDGRCKVNRCKVQKLAFHTDGWTIMLS